MFYPLPFAHFLSTLFRLGRQLSHSFNQPELPITFERLCFVRLQPGEPLALSLIPSLLLSCQFDRRRHVGSGTKRKEARERTTTQIPTRRDPIHSCRILQLIT